MDCPPILMATCDMMYLHVTGPWRIYMWQGIHVTWCIYIWQGQLSSYGLSTNPDVACIDVYRCDMLYIHMTGPLEELCRLHLFMYIHVTWRIYMWQGIHVTWCVYIWQGQLSSYGLSTNPDGCRWSCSVRVSLSLSLSLSFSLSFFFFECLSLFYCFL